LAGSSIYQTSNIKHGVKITAGIYTVMLQEVSMLVTVSFEEVGSS